MDEATARAIQCEAADALLNRGVSIPLKEFRIPFRKRPVKLRVTLKRPYMSGQIEFARTYMSMESPQNRWRHSPKRNRCVSSPCTDTR